MASPVLGFEDGGREEAFGIGDVFGGGVRDGRRIGGQIEGRQSDIELVGRHADFGRGGFGFQGRAGFYGFGAQPVEVILGRQGRGLRIQQVGLRHVAGLFGGSCAAVQLAAVGLAGQQAGREQQAQKRHTYPHNGLTLGLPRTCKLPIVRILGNASMEAADPSSGSAGGAGGGFSSHAGGGVADPADRLGKPAGVESADGYAAGGDSGGSARGPTIIWMFILAGHLAIQSSELPRVVVDVWGPKVSMALWAISLTLMFMRVAGDIVRQYGAQIPGALPVTTLTQTLAQLAVLILGILLTLSSFGFKITPILTALGVGGLAVALALQDTLSNLSRDSISQWRGRSAWATTSS